MEIETRTTDQELIAEGARLIEDLEAMEKCPLAKLRQIREAHRRNGVTDLAARMIAVQLKVLGD